MSEQPPYPPQDPNQPGRGQQPPPPPPGQQPPGWGQQPPPPPGHQPPGWGQQPPPPPGWTPPPGGPYGGAPQELDAATAIKYGWRAFKQHTGALLGITVVAMLVPIAIQVVGAIVSGGESFSFSARTGENPSFDFNAIALLFNLVGSVVSMILAATVIRMALDVVDGNEVNLGNAFSRVDFVQVVIAAILLGIATTIGMMLCFVPGFVVVFLTYFTNYFIVGKGQDAITAIKSSFQLTTSNVGPVLILALLCVVVVLAGVIACCVGLLVAYPVVVVAGAYAFRFLHREPIRTL